METKKAYLWIRAGAGLPVALHKALNEAGMVVRNEAGSMYEVADCAEQPGGTVDEVRRLVEQLAPEAYSLRLEGDTKPTAGTWLPPL